jgi:DUF917 family protein
MTTEISDIRGVEDFCTGLAFYGTGGGGRVEAGVDLLAPAIRAGKRITLVSPEELSDDTWTCWAIILGGRDPDEPPAADELAQFGLREERYELVPRLAASARELSEFMRIRLGALVSMELSSAATAATILTGLELGIPTLDSDYVGRAIPEVGLSKMDLLGRPPTPMVMIDRWGNVTILKSTVGAAMADRLGRMVSRAAYGKGIGTTGHLAQVREARAAFVRGSLLRAIRVGEALRRGATSREGVAPLIEATGGRVLFEAEAVATDWLSNEPYTFRQLVYRMKGVGRFAGATYRIWVKNEHHVVWRDEQVIATSPDIIAVLDAETLKPLTTLGDVTSGRRVSVFATRAQDPAWHSPPGLALLGPRHFGFDFDYVPFDQT